MDLRRERRVRVVGRVTPCSDPGRKWVSVVGAGGEVADQVSVVLGDGEGGTSSKNSHTLDWCYKEDETTNKIFSEEVKTLVQDVFHGVDASVLAFGARGSGKTLLIKGGERDPGLIPLAAAEILSLCEGTTNIVKISQYEVYQDHIFDLLEPKEKEVQVLEDAQGTTQLIGLSQVALKSISDFESLYLHGSKHQKSLKRTTSDAPSRSHVGVIFYVHAVNEESSAQIVGKMNFVDLADYIDIKQTGIINEGVMENARSKIIKSLYALCNVLSALNFNENHIGYRQSKFTHLMKAFTSKRKSRILMVTCMKSFPCQETIQAVSMASRTCVMANKPQYGSSKKSKSTQKLTPSHSSSSVRPWMTAYHGGKHESSRFSSINNRNFTPSSLTTRKLFSTESPIGKPMQMYETITSDMNGKKESQSEVLGVSVMDDRSETKSELSSVSMEVAIPTKEDVSSCKALDSSAEEEVPIEDIAEGVVLIQEKENASTNNTSQTSTTTSKGGCIEDMEYFRNHESTHPISDRLREIANSLRLLCSEPTTTLATPSNPTYDNSTALDLSESSTPKTPSLLTINNNNEIGATDTPYQTFRSRSAKVKKCLVEDLLTYLNNANKEELKELKGIGEKRATYIIEMRKNTPQPFNDVNDLQKIGLSTKQVLEMLKSAF